MISELTFKLTIIIEQGIFQVLCNEYLRNSYRGELFHPGTIDGMYKTKKGKPDAYLKQDNGKFIMAEYTTKSNAVKSAFMKKLSDDLKSCLEFASLGITREQVSQILLICNSGDLDMRDLGTLDDIVRPFDIPLKVIGLPTLVAFFSTRGKEFAKDILGLQFETDQVLARDEFIEQYDKSPLTTPLDTVLVGRSLERQTLLELLVKRDIIILSGPAGVGKSRLAIQVIDDFNSMDPTYEALYIFFKAGVIVEDLITKLVKGINYIILVDDANRQISNLLAIAERSCEEGLKIKIIATVRDYAREEVFRQLVKLNVQGYWLNTLDNQAIEQIISNAPYLIKDTEVKRQITAVAQGNPRLAIMAANVAGSSTKTSDILDVATIYNQYFKSITKDDHLFKDVSTQKVIGLVAFFHTLDVKSPSDLDILRTFDISPEQFWETSLHLDSLEVVDIYQHTVIKIADQVMATYLFYYVFFVLGTLSIRTLLNNYFENYYWRFRDVFMPAISAFGTEQIIHAHKVTYISFLDRIQNNSKSRHEFLELFGIYFPDNLLLHVSRLVRAQESSGRSYEYPSFNYANSQDHDPVLHLLDPLFATSESYFISAVVFAMRYIQKRKELLSKFIDQLNLHIKPASSDISCNFQKLHSFITLLLNDFRDDPAMPYIYYYTLKNALLNVYYDWDFFKSGDKGNAVLIDNFSALRAGFWHHMIEHYPNNSNIIDALLVDYLEQEPHLHNVLMFFDLPFLIRLMDKRLNPAEFKDCYFVNRYERLLSGRGKDSSNSLKRIKRRFNTETYKVYKTLVLDEKRFQGRYDDYEMLQKEKLVYLWRLFPVTNVPTFQSLYRHLQVICTFKFSHQYSIANGLGLVLVNAINNELNTGLSILRFYLQEGNIAYLNPYPIFLATYRQNKDCVTQLYQLIVEIDFQNRQTWLENYFYWLPEDLVTADSAEQLLACYNSSNTSNHNLSPEVLWKYERAKSQLIKQLYYLLYNKKQAEPEFKFQIHHEFFRNVTYISDEDMVFSKNLYFQQEQMDSHYDLYCNEFYYLLGKDTTFFDDYIDQLLCNVERGTAKGRKPLSKVWNFPDADNLIHGALVKIRQMKYHNSIDHISSIFFIQLDEDNKLKASRLISRLIQEFKEDLIMLNILLDNLRNYLIEFLDRFIAEILTANPDFEIFKKLVFYNSHFSSTGNQIWAEFKAAKLKHVYEVIHTLHNHYDYIEHQEFLANRIADFQESTAFERKLIFRGFR